MNILGGKIRHAPEPQNNLSWQERFDNLFPCIETVCDNNGNMVGYDREGDAEQQQCQYCFEKRLPIKNLIAEELARQREKEKGFWYIDLNGRVQHKSYMPTQLDEAGIWFGNKFDTCNKAVVARDKIKKLLDEINPH